MACTQAEISEKVLEQVRALQLLDTPPEESFDRLTRFTARHLRVPVSVVTILDSHRQFFKSSFGLHEPYCACRETPLSHSF